MAVPGPTDLAVACEVVEDRLAPTPLLESPGLGAFIKAESLQPTGSFKVRGGLVAVSRLDRGRALVTASAGNHGLGVAYAAAALDRPATVVVPETASPAKVERLRRLPIRLEQVGRGYDEAEARALELARTGAVFVSPYNDTNVIAGTATIGDELDDELSGDLCVVTPVGGGGLISGLVLWAAGRRGTRVVGVQAAASPALGRAVEAGQMVPIDVAPTLADGLAGNLEPGSVTIGLAARAAALVEVSEPEIEAAMRFLASEHGLVAEGAGAVASAAVLAGKVEAKAGETLVVLLTGRNIALTALAQVLEGDAVRDGP